MSEPIPAVLLGAAGPSDPAAVALAYAVTRLEHLEATLPYADAAALALVIDAVRPSTL